MTQLIVGILLAAAVVYTVVCIACNEKQGLLSDAELEAYHQHRERIRNKHYG